MRNSIWLATATGLLGATLPAPAQTADFNLTYHVERTPAAKLSIETCGAEVQKAAGEAGLTADVRSFPGELVTVSGGAEGSGVFVVQCIAVDDTTVSVVQGIDYRNEKGLLGSFADGAIAAVKAAAQ
ncbi:MULTISPECIES: DUF6180 family protein [unclassified Aureimonas]|uniref:DUF6180 family protein n=1 Tax=unclassified Aureimonas TaxID=2615206 RepID=UPI0006F97D21|nr:MULTISPECIES: DUF6180 family protein [unclassified Aureimonas]KQT52103.1 hypothetical protein ASG62_15660 [Aureimonas sp. Leaf427]